MIENFELVSQFDLQLTLDHVFPDMSSAAPIQETALAVQRGEESRSCIDGHQLNESSNSVMSSSADKRSPRFTIDFLLSSHYKENSDVSKTGE